MSALVLLALAMAAGPRRAQARAAKAGSRPAKVKVTQVRIETDGREVVLEAKAGDVPATGADQSDDPSGPAGASPDTAGADTGEVALPLDEGKWDPVCTPPCDHDLPRAAIYRVTGTDITTSSTFTLPPSRPQATLVVKAGASRWYWTGIILTAVGGSFLLGGLGPPLLLGGSFSTTEKVLGGTGAVLVGVGLPLWLLNRTTVSIF
ncbi:MAG: hypothetical protein ABUS79_18745 [Pseudomonadota bacterium]